MEQKEVKIIGLKLNQQMGILQSCELKFNPENQLIAVKGEVGSGKTTLQKSLMLGTHGSDTLKDDKTLYGIVDEEIQLLDGDTNVYVGCKSSKKRGLDFVIYTKDLEGKVIKDPVIDGVKVTPASYLKNLQTALTWRIDELMSENSTVQKKLLLQLYKSELANIGVVFDKKSDKYSESILGKIDLAENKRSEKEFLRKQVGGFLNQLEPIGIDPEEESTHPKFISINDLEKKKSNLEYKIDNEEEVKKQRLVKIKNEADGILLKLREENSSIKKDNQQIQVELDKKKEKYSQNIHTLNGIKTDLETLKTEGCLALDYVNGVNDILDSNFKNISLSGKDEKQVIEFDLDEKCVTKYSEWKGSEYVGELLQSLESKKNEYIEVLNAPNSDNVKLNEEIELIKNNIILANKNNDKVKMLTSFLEWKEANNDVIELRDEYANMLNGINTGVDGLNIEVEENEIYLTYNGAYDTKYFNNPNKDKRKLSSYSGTQKPIICLLLQSYLLSKKPKAMRYLWIDNVPVDNKTKALLEKMGKDLGVTIIVNITGDFTKEGLENGEILIEGGEVFFK